MYHFYLLFHFSVLFEFYFKNIDFIYTNFIYSFI